MEIRYHRLGTDSADDRLVFSTPDRAGVGLRARGLRRRPAARGHDLARHRPREPDLRRRPLRRRRGRGRAAGPRRGRRPLRAHRDDRPDALPAHRPRRAARPRDRRRRRRPGDDPGGHPGVRRGARAGPLVGDRFAVAYLHHAHGRLAIFELDGRHVGGCRAARDRLDRGAGRPPRRRRALPDVHDLRVAADRPRRPDGRRHGPRGPAPGARVGPGRLRHRAGRS